MNVSAPLLPRLGRAEAALRQRLHLGREPMPFTLGSHALTVSLASPREAAMAGALPLRLQLLVGDSPGTIGLSASLARLLLDVLSPGLPANHPDTDLLLEAALATALETLERLLGQGISLAPAGEKSPADLLAIGLRVSRDGVSQGWAVLRLGAAEAAMLAGALDRLPPRPTGLERLALGVTVEAGSAHLPVNSLRHLRRGDILLSDETMPEGAARIVIAGRRCLNGRAADKGYQIITAATGHTQGLTVMDETREDAAEPMALDDLTVQVVFEVARLELPLSELRKMRPGYVLELDRPAGLGVDLMVRGQPIGKAELVQVDNTLGARILRLFEHD